MFQDDRVFQRLKLHPDDYFKQLKTVAFEKVCGSSFVICGRVLLRFTIVVDLLVVQLVEDEPVAEG